MFWTLIHMGFYLPDYEISKKLFSEEYLRNVSKGQYWIPKKKDLKENVIINKKITSTGIADLILSNAKGKNI